MPIQTGSGSSKAKVLAKVTAKAAPSEQAKGTVKRHASKGDTLVRINPPTQVIDQMLTDVANKYQIPPAILKGLAFLESGWRQYDKTGKAIHGRVVGVDQGIMQINERFHPEAFPRARHDIQYNIEVGAAYLKSHFDRYDNWTKAIAAYNAGSIKYDQKGHIANQSYVDLVKMNSVKFDPSVAALFTVERRPTKKPKVQKHLAEMPKTQPVT